MKLRANKANKFVNIKDFVAGNEEDDKEGYQEDAKKQNRETESDMTSAKVDRPCPDTGVGTNKWAIEETEKDDKKEEFVMDSIVDRCINQSQIHW